MGQTVKLNHLQEELASLEYPIDRESVRSQFSDVTVEFSEGEEPLPAIVDRIDDDRFESPDDLSTAIYNALPVEAVGEPGQSEGDA